MADTAIGLALAALDDTAGMVPDITFAADGTAIIPEEDGGITVDYDYRPDEEQLGDPNEHGANLALHLSEGELATIADDLIQAVEDDQASRKDWHERMARGIKMMGVAEESGAVLPFEGASTVVHPMLAEAAVQFQSRAIAELYPAGGPAKAVILGTATPERVEQQKRVEGYINYLYTYEMKEAFWEQDQLLFYLPLAGSAFKKVYPCPIKKRVTEKFVMAEDLVVPYSATSLEDASRYTHVLHPKHNDLIKMMRSGFYRDVDLEEPDSRDRSPVKERIDDAEGRTPSYDGKVDRSLDYEHTVYEVHTDYDLPGFEDVDEADEPTGIALPYVITVDVDSQQVLAIRRNWKEGDKTRARRVFFTHYKFLPGLGFYGFGFLHTIGGLSRAATGALRQLLDAGKFATLQGGFKARDAKLPGGTTTVNPGEWQDVDCSTEDLSKAFFRPPYAEPSGTMFNLLGFLQEAGQRFASTTEAMVGDGDNKGPVGTTIALIEQGSKVFSAIHKRCHKALGEELRMVADIAFELMDEGAEYPYQVEGDEVSGLMKTDFDERLDVVPVSDPNIFSSTQRIAQAQAVYQVAMADPSGAVNKKEAVRRLFEAMRIDGIERLIPPADEAKRMDPIAENMAFLYGKPVQAFAEQDHAAHMAAHEAWFGTLPQEGQKMLQGAFYAHLAEHMAQKYRAELAAMAMQAGIQLPPAPDFNTDDGTVEYDELPQDVENQIAQLAAQGSQLLAQKQQAEKPPEQQPEDMKVKAEIERDNAEFEAEQARKDREFAREQARKDAEARAEIARKHGKAQADIADKDVRTASDLLRQEVRDEAQSQPPAGPQPPQAPRAPGVR